MNFSGTVQEPPILIKFMRAKSALTLITLLGVVMASQFTSQRMQVTVIAIALPVQMETNNSSLLKFCLEIRPNWEPLMEV